jgi:anti-anti-sigma factor
VAEDLQILETNGAHEGIRIIRLIGPCTINDLFKFQDALRQDSVHSTILDVTEVPYMDSATLGCIIRLHVSSEQKKLKYAVVGASGRINALFKATRVDSVLIQYPTVEAAIAAF